MAGRAGRRAAAALLLAALLSFLPAAPGLSASPGGMAVDVFESVTKSPDARKNAAASRTSGAWSGAADGSSRGPTAPQAPAVPGAPGAEAESGESLRERVARRQGAGRIALRTLTLEHGGVRRAAVVAVPAGWQAGAGGLVPAIIFLHGAGGSAAQAMRQTGLAGRAAAAGFLAVFPEGLGGSGGQAWNAWTCCGDSRDRRVDDVGFVAALITRLRADFRVDPARIHLAGFSNGAMLASRFVLERPGLAASLCSVAGGLPCDLPRPTRDLPVLVIHGDQDQVARFGLAAGRPATGRLCEDSPARAQAEFWAKGMDLPGSPAVREGAQLRVEDFAARNGRAHVRFIVVKGGGHAWPGGARERYPHCDLPVAGVDATGVLLDFIRRADAAARQERAGEARPAAARTGAGR